MLSGVSLAELVDHRFGSSSEGNNLSRVLLRVALLPEPLLSRVLLLPLAVCWEPDPFELVGEPCAFPVEMSECEGEAVDTSSGPSGGRRGALDLEALAVCSAGAPDGVSEDSESDVVAGREGIDASVFGPDPLDSVGEL